MAYFQKNVPPPNKTNSFSIVDFSGGLNNRSTQLKDNECSDVLNEAFSDNTLFEKRKGIDAYDALALTEPITFIDEFNPYSDTPQLIRGTNSTLYADETQICTVAGQVHGTNYMGYYIFLDGDKVRLYGSFPQTADTHIGIIGTAVSTDIVMELVDPPTGYTPLDNTNDTGKWQYDYTNLKCWYEPCANEVADTYKGANITPSNAKYVAVHGDRLFISGSESDNDNVYISDIMNGFYFPVFLPIQMPPNSDKVVGLKVFMDSVVVGRHRDVHVIYGNTNRSDLSPDVFRLKQVNTHTGFANQDAVDVANNYLFYVGNDGNMYAMHTTQTNTDILATTILNQQIDIFQSPLSRLTSDLSSCSSVYFKDEWRVSIGDITLVYSYRTKSWTVYKYAGIKITSFYIKNYELLMGTDTYQIAVEVDNYSDFGEPYQAYWKSKSLDFDDPSTYKQFREFYIVAHTYNDYNSTINMTFDIDYSEINNLQSITNQTSIWGKSVFGSRFISNNIVASLPVVIGQRGRNMKIKISNGYFKEGVVATHADLANYPAQREGLLIYVTDENAYYLNTNHQWVAQTTQDIIQPMKVYEINGMYEFRGKR